MDKQKDSGEELREANQTIGLGIGVGALGAGAAAVTGAVCPVCYFVVPALVGAGMLKRSKLKKSAKKIEEPTK